MKKNYIKLSLNSISFKLLSVILLTVVPIVCLAIYNNQQSRNVLLSQVETTRINMLKTYTDQIDNQLHTALSYVINMSTNETDPQIIALSQDKNAPQYAKLRIHSDMSEKLLVNNYMDGYFLYVIDSTGYTTFINAVNRLHPITRAEILQSYIQEQTDKTLDKAAWQLVTLDNTDYLLLIAGGADNIWTGAYVSLTSLMSHLTSDDMPGSRLHILSEEALENFTRELPADVQCISSGFSSANVVLAETFSKSEILSALPFMQKYTLLISAIVIVLLGILILRIRGIATKPLLNLSLAMKHIQEGNLDYRIPEIRASTEIELVNSTFNQMVSEVQHLKIDIYEEQLKVQKSQLHNLQMQIKPHFLINSLNMVYNLIETRQLPLACRLIQFSVDFFRYMVKVDKDLVPLNEEIDHVKAYLNIQSIRYQNHFSYTIDVSEFISDMLIPPIMLQTFVENSIKYALSFNNRLHMDIQITSFEKDYFPYAKMVIADNGPGYPAEDLEKLNAGNKIVKKDGSHTGIRNTVRRIQILFGDRAQCRFYNNGGAVTEVILPATFSDNGDDDEE